MADRPAPEIAAEASESDTDWHCRSIDDALGALTTSREGLDDAEVGRRLEVYGPNELVDRGSKHPARILWEQLTAVMVVILIGASLLSLALGKFLEAGAIGAIVVLFVLLGFFQEYRAERAIAALRQMAVPTVRVVRSGRSTEVPAVELVPGDIVHIEAGSVVPADLRLVEAANLRVQESALTGESEAVDKGTDAIEHRELPLGDRRNLAYSGTQVVYGRGRGVVVGTGMTTELGRIAELLQDVTAERTVLQERLDRVGKQLALVGVVVAVVVVALGALGGEDWSDLVLTAISVAVAVIPEGLPAVVTFTLALGAQRMLRRNALIRKLPAVETLGSVTTICSDKTGTLTQNRMTVVELELPDHTIDISQWQAGGSSPGREGEPVVVTLALVAGALCNDGELDAAAGAEPATVGDPTETALLDAAHRAGIDVGRLRREVPRVGERPFDSERKRMSTIHEPIGRAVVELEALPQDVRLSFVKGAVDGLLAHVSYIQCDHDVVGFDDGWRQRVEQANDAMAARGERVLAVAYRPLPDESDPEDELVLLGLVGIIDPPRSEARRAVDICGRAGIRPVMITGDHPVTARAIADELGIDGGGRALTGLELDRLDDAEFDRAVREVSVFARVAPEHKLRIIAALQRQGEIVAMTGDGVNDAPALKRADIGVAMGITGTDVSKEAADVVLRDDNFATIVAAVEEGRVIYDNLRRFVSFAVAGNLGKIIVMIGWPIPVLLAGGETGAAVALLPLQLLWLNLMTDGLLGLSMGAEPAESDVMDRPPNDPASGIWSNGLGRRTAWVGATIGTIALAIGIAYDQAGRDEWQTMMFTSLAFLQVFQALGSRSNTESLRRIGWFSNPLMIWIGAAVVALQLAALYTPLNEFLDLDALGAVDLALCIGSGVVLLAVLETVKAWQRRQGAQMMKGSAASVSMS